MNPIIFVPGVSILMLTALELPKEAKKVLFKAPVWLTSSVISLMVGWVGRGVLGPMTGYMTEIILFPGLYLTKKHLVWSENKSKKKRRKKNGLRLHH